MSGISQWFFKIKKVFILVFGFYGFVVFLGFKGNALCDITEVKLGGRGR